MQQESASPTVGHGPRGHRTSAGFGLGGGGGVLTASPGVLDPGDPELQIVTP